MRAHARGELVAPPRTVVDLGAGRLVVTAGSRHGHWYGYRSYDSIADSVQVVVVHSWDGELVGIVHGTEIGLRRTGAIGALAADLLTPTGAVTVALVGAGEQAWAQVAALATVRELRAVRVASPTDRRRDELVARIRKQLGCHAGGHRDNRAAVVGADVVVLATNSVRPVIEPQWLGDTTHVTSLGPKTVAGSELPAAILDRAGVLMTDSAEQLAAYDPEHIAAHRDVMELGEALEHGIRRPSGAGLTVFLSTGLAGTEVAAAVGVLAESGAWPMPADTAAYHSAQVVPPR